VDVATQTHALLDRPTSPLFVPAKTGVDVATQIDTVELFDFDLEVEPLLEVLVGKTLQASMIELLDEVPILKQLLHLHANSITCEANVIAHPHTKHCHTVLVFTALTQEELEAIQRKHAEYEDARNAELAEVQRLEGEAMRRYAEKERRLAQERTRVAAKAQLEQKVAARVFAQSLLSQLRGTVFDSLHDSGYFYDPLQREVRPQCVLPVFLHGHASMYCHIDETGEHESMATHYSSKKNTFRGCSPPCRRTQLPSKPANR
jgi:hypothetical protein